MAKKLPSTTELGWATAGLALLLAAAILIWAGSARPGQSPETTASPPRPGSASAPTLDDAALAPLRERAALEPCPSPPPGGPLPSGRLAGIEVPCLGAPGQVDLGGALAGRVALLNLWASWCAPCREEIPLLAAYAVEPDAVAVVGVNVRDRPTAALSLLAALDAHYPSVTDPDGALRRALRAPPVLPASVVVLPDGSVRLVPPQVFGSVEEVRGAVTVHVSPTGGSGFR